MSKYYQLIREMLQTEVGNGGILRLSDPISFKPAPHINAITIDRLKLSSSGLLIYYRSEYGGWNLLDASQPRDLSNPQAMILSTIFQRLSFMVKKNCDPVIIFTDKLPYREQKVAISKKSRMYAPFTHDTLMMDLRLEQLLKQKEIKSLTVKKSIHVSTQI